MAFQASDFASQCEIEAQDIEAQDQIVSEQCNHDCAWSSGDMVTGVI